MVKNTSTQAQYYEVVEKCKSLFLKKNKDYGTAWAIMRLPSITDQIYIKAQRIRTIEELKTQTIADSIEGEYIGIINYCVMALMLCRNISETEINANTEACYNKTVLEVFDLMMLKNHDYGEAWRQMRISSFTDLILQKLLRVKQIEDNAGSTIVSEGVDANYQDMMNYAIFALIRMEEKL